MPRKSDSPIAWGSAKESKQIIVDAAARCFERYGVQRTSMDDIAESAGISRKTLYRVFEDRPKLIQAVLLSRWAIAAKKLQNRAGNANSFEEALLEGTVTAVSSIREDKLANDIIHKATDHTLEQFILHGDDRAQTTSQHIWQSAIAEGRKAGVIKQNLSDERVVEIIRSIHSLLVMRDDSPAKQREFLKDVLLPAILVTPKG